MEVRAAHVGRAHSTPPDLTRAADSHRLLFACTPPTGARRAGTWNRRSTSANSRTVCRCAAALVSLASMLSANSSLHICPAREAYKTTSERLPEWIEGRMRQYPEPSRAVVDHRIADFHAMRPTGSVRVPVPPVEQCQRNGRQVLLAAGQLAPGRSLPPRFTPPALQTEPAGPSGAPPMCIQWPPWVRRDWTKCSPTTRTRLACKGATGYDHPSHLPRERARARCDVCVSTNLIYPIETLGVYANVLCMTTPELTRSLCCPPLQSFQHVLVWQQTATPNWRLVG